MPFVPRKAEELSPLQRRVQSVVSRPRKLLIKKKRTGNQNKQENVSIHNVGKKETEQKPRGRYGREKNQDKLQRIKVKP